MHSIAVPLRISELSEAQEQKEQDYYRAARILRENGFPDARVILLHVSRPSDPPCSIALERI